MAALAPSALLTAWEQVRSLPAARRPAALLPAFGKPAQPSVGTRAAALLEVYTENFGPRIDGLATCPGCGTAVELSVPVAEMTAGVSAAQPVEPFTIEGHTVHWRLPDDADLAAAADCADTEQGALLLLSRCVQRAEPEHHPLPARARELLAERIAAADPFADLSFTLTCPQCPTEWDSLLDIAEFVGSHLQAQAHRLLREVDELARAYGWSEEQILALSQDRRDSYLELLRHG